jgi:aconitase A
MGVIPLVFTNGETRRSLKLIGNESIDLKEWIINKIKI